MSETYRIECDCAAVQLELRGEPLVRGFCHCEDCRELLKTPYHSVTAWDRDAVVITEGEAHTAAYSHPTKRMSRVYCRDCGDTLFNTNAKGWRVVSQLLIRKCCGNRLPAALRSQKHFFYRERVVDVDDDLPRHE